MKNSQPLVKEMFNVFDNTGKVHYRSSKREYLGNTAAFEEVDTSSREHRLGKKNLLFKSGLPLNEFNGEDFDISYRDNKTVVYVYMARSNSYDKVKIYETNILVIDYDTKTINHIVNDESVKVSNDFTVAGVLDFVITNRFGKTSNILECI